MSAPGLSRANGPMIAPGAMRAPSMWLKARIVTSSATSTPGPKTTFGSIWTSRLRVVGEEHRVGRHQRGAARHRLGPAAHLEMPLRPGELGAIVDAEHLVEGDLHGLDGEAALIGDRHRVGQVEFVLIVPVADRVQ